MDRYSIALAEGREAYRAAVDEDAALLKSFGLQLLSVEGCVRAAVISELRGRSTINAWNCIEISLKVWNWLRPLLVRLHECEAESTVSVHQLLAAK